MIAVPRRAVGGAKVLKQRGLPGAVKRHARFTGEAISRLIVSKLYRPAAQLASLAFVHADIDAVRECVEVNAGRIGVIERNEDVAVVRCPHDRRKVLDFHLHRTGTPHQVGRVSGRISAAIPAPVRAG